MKARFTKGFRHRTVIVNKKIVFIINEAMQSFRFDLNQFDKEKARIIAAPGSNADTLQLLEKISKLHTDQEIMEDIERDYKEEGWTCG